MCECNKEGSMDITTPRNVHLSAFYKRSFAFYTVKSRLPIILTNIIDNLVRNKSQIIENFGEDAKEELKIIIGNISEFKYEIQTNKPIKLLTSEASDAKIYNQYINEKSDEEGPPTHFHSIWLLTECYMYRRIRQIFEEMDSLRDYDPFRNQKEDAFSSSLPMIKQLAKYVLSLVDVDSFDLKTEFISLLKLNLWGNKCDLSISLGQISEHATLFDTAALDEHILSDYSEDIWNAVVDETATSDIIDIVLDNAGYEVFTDMCLADYMISKNLCKTIRFYVKTIPWFISDVMTHDFYWLLDKLELSEDEDLKILSERWKSYIQNGVWKIEESDFWTLPFDFTYMAKIDPNLYKQLSGAKMVIFKGDLNYRKLFGEMNWDPTTSIDDGLQDFNPSKLCILRTIKADIVCGLKKGVAEKTQQIEPKWMETGNWGLIQFSEKIVSI